jgi:hypothetical protein
MYNVCNDENTRSREWCMICDCATLLCGMCASVRAHDSGVVQMVCFGTLQNQERDADA